MAERPSNAEIAAKMERIADLLETQGANSFRIDAYRAGAATIRTARQPVADLAAQGDEKALRHLPRIGEGLARLITEIVQTGQSSLLNELEAAVSPEDALAQVPGVGADAARQIVAGLGVTDLEELELAAHDGRLEKLEGFGPERIRTIQLSLAGMLSTSARRRTVQRLDAAERDDEQIGERPSVDAILDVDAQYRGRAGAGELRTIAPKRFNPKGEAWLPVLDTDADGWHFTALYSNTARAHELGATHDWVVVYYERGGHQHQATVLTATRGPLAGKRVVRGREPETRRHYGLAG